MFQAAGAFACSQAVKFYDVKNVKCTSNQMACAKCQQIKIYDSSQGNTKN